MRVYLIKEEKKHSRYTVYAWVLEEKYYSENNEIKQCGGSSMPYRFVVANVDDKFVITDAITPRDGVYYSDDMRSIFPSSVRNDMEKVHTDGTIEKLNADVQEQKELYFHK